MAEANRLAETALRCDTRLRRRIRWLLGRAPRVSRDTGDIVQSVYARVLERIDGEPWRSDSEFVALATVIARNMIRDDARRNGRRRFETAQTRLYPSNWASRTPSAHAVADEDAARLLDAIEALAEDHRRVVELREFEGLSFRQIGERLHRSENAAQLLHSRALTQLGIALRST